MLTYKFWVTILIIVIIIMGEIILLLLLNDSCVMKSTVQYLTVEWFFGNWTKQFILRTSSKIYYCLIAMIKLRTAQIKKIHNFILYYIIKMYDVNHINYYLSYSNKVIEHQHFFFIILILDQDNPKPNKLEWTLKKCCLRLLFSLHFLPHKGHSNLGSFWHSNCWWRTKVFLCEYDRSQTVQLKLDEIVSANATNMR